MGNFRTTLTGSEKDIERRIAEHKLRGGKVIRQGVREQNLYGLTHDTAASKLGYKRTINLDGLDRGTHWAIIEYEDRRIKKGDDINE